jgi:hypothetical protein
MQSKILTAILGLISPPSRSEISHPHIQTGNHPFPNPLVLSRHSFPTVPEYGTLTKLS